MHTTLGQLHPGQTGHVTAVHAEGETGRRLREMGLVPGADIRMEGRAPLLDPVAVRLGGVKLALRRQEAACVLVEQGVACGVMDKGVACVLVEQGAACVPVDKVAACVLVDQKGGLA